MPSPSFHATQTGEHRPVRTKPPTIKIRVETYSPRAATRSGAMTTKTPQHVAADSRRVLDRVQLLSPRLAPPIEACPHRSIALDRRESESRLRIRRQSLLPERHYQSRIPFQ